LIDTVEKQQRFVAGVRFNKVGKLYHFDFSSIPDLKVSSFVIVNTARGRRMGQVMAFATVDEQSERAYKPIMRKATPRDLVLNQQWVAKEADSLAKCIETAEGLGGYDRVKFVAVQYNYDGSILTLLYSCDDKLNMNKLSNALKRRFKSAIELRQIGPRDVAKFLGGSGACGKEVRCCSSFLTDFSPISIKMAKVQGISLNPSEITGMCGRLRCCLVYEYEQYLEARKQLPRKNKVVGTPFGEGKVVDVHPLQDAVTVLIPDEGFRLVLRVDLVPLAEMRALAQKASQTCDHGDEGCDCGAKPAKKTAQAVNDEEDED